MKDVGVTEILMIVAGILIIIFWLFMLRDCLMRPYWKFPVGGKNTRFIWILVILLVGPFLIGAAIYYFVIKRKDLYQAGGERILNE